MIKETRVYRTRWGKTPFNHWLKSVKDKSTQLRIRNRIRRMTVGQYGDYKLRGDTMSRVKLNKLTSDFTEQHIKSLRNKKEAALYLQVALEDYQQNSDGQALLLALRDVADAQGGIGELAKKANLNRESLYKTLSSRGNPKISTFAKLLNGLGFKLLIKPA